MGLNPNDQAMRNYTEQYEYDEVGNIQKMIHKADKGDWTRHYQYDDNNNRLLSTSLPGDPDKGSFTGKYEYNKHGNMIKMPHLNVMEWDFKDQLHMVDRMGGGKAYYVYDARGQRVRKVLENQKDVLQEERIYIGGFEIYRKYNSNGIKLERETLHIMDDQQRIALVETKTLDAEHTNDLNVPVIRYQLGNHLGSASLELDQEGSVISYEEYYPYGSTSYQAGRSVAEVSLKRYRYTGKERDEETGLYYHGARYYVPWLGRWTSCDPAGMTDGANPHVYARNNPVRLVDPNGAEDEPWYEQTGAFLARNVVVPLVELVVGGSSASAPTSKAEAAQAPKSESYGAQAVKIAATMSIGRLVTSAAGPVARAFGGTAPGLGSRALAMGTTAAGAGVAVQGASDVANRLVSPPQQYLGGAALGFGLGFVGTVGAAAIARGLSAVRPSVSPPRNLAPPPAPDPAAPAAPVPESATPVPESAGPPPKPQLPPPSPSQGGATGKFIPFRAKAFKIPTTLETTVSKLHQLLDKIAMSRKTAAIGVVETPEGPKLVIASSDPQVPKAIREFATQEGIDIASGPGHAETTIYDYAKTHKFKLQAIAPSRDFCWQCWIRGLESGAELHGVVTPRQMKP